MPYKKADQDVTQEGSTETTSKVLELLHMDLIRLMQVESIACRRYVFLCADDFSRYAWVEF